MAPSSVTLRKERTPTDTRSLWAELSENGDLTIEGQDLGKEVEAFWGAGNTEYEWTITIRAADIPKLAKLLSAAAGDDLLKVLGDRFAEDEKFASKSFLEKNGIPLEFWSRVGD